MLLEAKGITLGYEDINIIEDLSCSIPSGKVTILVGSNGCGKSTLLHGLSRLLTLKKGEVYLDVKPMNSYSSKELATKIAILPQGPIAPEGITVEELCYYGRHPHKKWFKGNSTKDEDVVNWALEATDMAEFKDRDLDALSGGQRQRAWIAMALAQETEVLLLDEPTTYLDLAYQIEILNLLKRLNSTTKKTIIMVLHELNQAARYADYLICMKKGIIHSEGKVEEVFNESMIREVFKIDSKIIDDPVTLKPMCVPIDLVKSK